MGTQEKTVAARNFVRNLNILVRQVNLYGLGHKQVTRQYELAWTELSKVLAEDGKFQIVAAGEQLMMDGVPLKAGSAERSLAQEFLAAGLAGLSLSAGLTNDEFGRMVHIFGKSKPAELLPTLKQEFGRDTHVRASGYQFVDDEKGERPATGGESAGLGGELAAALLGGAVAPELAALNDPGKLLQLLSAGQSNGTSVILEAASDGNDTATLEEDDVAGVIHWLKRLSGGGGPAPDEVATVGQIENPQSGEDRTEGRRAEESADNTDAPELSSRTQQAVRLALSAALNEANEGVPRPLLIKLAEHLAIRAAMEKYERGESPFNAVQQTLERLKGEIATLHKLIREREGNSEAANAAMEAYSQELDRQFWAAVPGRNKLQVLLSPEAWCIPPANIRSFLEELIARKGDRVADRILRNYCSFLESTEQEAPPKVAAGLVNLAHLYGSLGGGLLDFAIRWVDASLTHDCSPEMKTALGRAQIAMLEQADKTQDYASIHKALCSLDRLYLQSAELSRELRGQVQIENRIVEFVAEALRLPQPDLLEVLRKIPQAAAPELASRFGKATTREECNRVQGLAQELGLNVVEELQRTLSAEADTPALCALGLLTSLDVKAVERALPGRLQKWSSVDQAAAIRQIACSGVPDRGNLLLRLTGVLHPLVLPQALDEIGISGRADAGALLHLSQGQGIAAESPYIQVKAIEAIGRLRTPAAVPQLKELVSAKKLWKWQYPQEIRIAALQALMRIDTSIGRNLLGKSGISETELRLAPLSPGPENWVRHRRYSRIPLEGGLMATLTAGSETCSLTLETMSLVGGSGAANARSLSVKEAKLEVQMGLRRLQLQVLLCEPRPYQIAFEIASIDLEDRSRLRKFLAAQARRSN